MPTRNLQPFAAICKGSSHGGDPGTRPPSNPAPTAEWILVNNPAGSSTEEGLAKPISTAVEQGRGHKASFDQIATPDAGWLP